MSKNGKEPDEIRESESLDYGALFDVWLLDLANKDTECQVKFEF